MKLDTHMEIQSLLLITWTHMHTLRSSQSSITPKPHHHNQHTLWCRLVVLHGQVHLFPWVSVIAFNLENVHTQAKIFTMNLQSLQGHLHTTSTHYNGGLLFCVGGCIFFVIQSLLLITCTRYNPSSRHSLQSYLHTQTMMEACCSAWVVASSPSLWFIHSF